MPLQNKNNQGLWFQTHKLTPPSINQKAITRNQLEYLLDQSTHLKLTSILSPAGFGKSMLVANWLSKRQHSYGWYSLDSSDNEPNQFGIHLIYALHQATNGGCPNSLALAQKQDYSNLKSLLTKATLEISHQPCRCYLVFDDIQVLNDLTIIQAFTQWVKQTPNDIHIILCGRDNTLIPLSSFRVKGQLLEVGADQLAFSVHETAEFLKLNLPFAVSKEKTEKLTAITSGWPAAMQLIIHGALSESDLIDTSGRLGIAQYEVSEFLIHEVIANLPEKIKDFLLKTSLLEQFNKPLVDSLMPDQNNQAIIYELEQRQLFIHRIESQPGWFRLQSIFRHCLLDSLKQNSSSHFNTLIELTIHALLENNLNIEAIHLTLSTSNTSAATQVLKHIGMELYRNGQFITLSKLFGQLSTSDIQTDPKLTLLYSWVLLATYRESDVRELFLKSDSQTPKETRAEQAIAQAQAAINVEQFDKAHDLARKAMTLLNPDSFVSRTVIHSVLGQSALCRGDLKEALNQLKEAEKLAFEHHLVQQQLWLLCLTAEIHSEQSNIKKAISIQNEAIEIAHDRCVENVLHMEFLYRNQTRLLIELGDLNHAEQLILKSEKIIEPLGNYGLLNVHVNRGLVALWQNRKDEAKNMAFQVNYLLQNFSFHSDWLAYANDFLLAAMASKSLNFKPQFNWRKDILDSPVNNHFFQHYQRGYAIHLYLIGEHEQAINLLKKLIRSADKYGLFLQRLKNQIQLCVWLHNSEGLACWETLLPDLKETKIQFSLWLSSRFNIDASERNWPEWEIWFGQEKPKNKNQPSQQKTMLHTLNLEYANPLDQVTPKELKVLLLIGTGMNNDEIAANMHIASSTVKSHIRRLYRKLNINRRSQAIQICRLIQ